MLAALGVVVACMAFVGRWKDPEGNEKIGKVYDASTSHQAPQRHKKKRRRREAWLLYDLCNSNVQ